MNGGSAACTLYVAVVLLISIGLGAKGLLENLDFRGRRGITSIAWWTGLAIYAARGLRSGSAEITAVAFTGCGGWQFFSRNTLFLQIGVSMSSLFSGTDRISLR